jgi:hypothetical protein
MLVEGYEVIKPAVRLADAVTIIKGDLDGAMCEMVIRGFQATNGPLWL